MLTCLKCKRSDVKFYGVTTTWAKGKAYRYPNRECRACSLDRHRTKKYGITPEQYKEMSIAQDGKCLLCLRPPKAPRTNLDVDHDHVTGKVRGLLCSGCNRMLGRVSDNPEILERAVLYLRKHAG